MASTPALLALTPDLHPPAPLVQRDPRMQRDGERPPIRTHPITHADTSPLHLSFSTPQALAPDAPTRLFSGTISFTLQRTINVSASRHHLGGIASLATYSPSGEFDASARLQEALGNVVNVTV